MADCRRRLQLQPYFCWSSYIFSVVGASGTICYNPPARRGRPHPDVAQQSDSQEHWQAFVEETDLSDHDGRATQDTAPRAHSGTSIQQSACGAARVSAKT